MNALDKRTRTMRRCGGASIALGVITLVTGVTAGVLSIVTGGTLISKSHKQ